MSDLFEIRDYHYRPERIDEYRRWAHEAAPVLGDILDLVGFWVDAGIEPRISGSTPMDLPLGSANITWVIRWRDLAHREREWAAMWENPAWKSTWEKHPGFEDYLHMSVRFLVAA